MLSTAALSLASTASSSTSCIVQPRYFSDQQGSIVEFFINSVAKKYEVQVNNTFDQTNRLSSKEKQKNVSKTAAMITLASPATDNTFILHFMSKDKKTDRV